ncbi:hypothetical protein WA026_009251 [Henosepilachna vigintioctopunctata]|uniref:Protein DPCD n=1 Tax=Henosepilachna vigintioctopunctata TaxID=420089 RepID=A0AAW1UNA5_9CUCU
MEYFLNELRDAKKSAIVDNFLKKVHYHLKDERELVEEYNLQTNIVTRRAWRKKDTIGNDNAWEIELGDPGENFQVENIPVIKENNSQPSISRRNTQINLEWRIRNLPYPIETYSVTCNDDKKNLTVRTSNKKYFKILNIPELERLCIPLKQENVTFSHKYNTLIITYKKPQQLLNFEKAVLEIAKEVQPQPQVFDKKNCKQS